MKGYTEVTDNEWFRFLSSRPDIDAVNFRQLSGGRQFRGLDVGEPFLVKLHHPENYIVGGGFFVRYVRVASRLAWDAFGEKNGAPPLTRP
jgi:putative restriction endonuclease